MCSWQVGVVVATLGAAGKVGVVIATLGECYPRALGQLHRVSVVTVALDGWMCAVHRVAAVRWVLS